MLKRGLLVLLIFLVGCAPLLSEDEVKKISEDDFKIALDAEAVTGKALAPGAVSKVYIVNCKDSDGQNDTVAGKVTQYFMLGGRRGVKLFRDECTDERTLKEYYCENKNMRSKLVNCKQGCVEGACENWREGVDLVLDEASGVMMEPIVLEKIQRIYSDIGLCDECALLTTPTISILDLEGDQIAILSLYFNGKIMRTFTLYDLASAPIIEDDPDGTIEGRIVTGTNSIKILIPLISPEELPIPNNYFQNSYYTLYPGEETTLNFNLQKIVGVKGTSYIFVTEEDTFESSITADQLDKIAVDQSRLAGLGEEETYYLFATSNFFPGLAEGSFYMGDNVIRVNYGGRKYFDYYSGGHFFGSFAHEYGHLLQHSLNLDTYYVSGFILEGITDAMAIHNGYRSWEEVGIYEELEPGCSGFSGSHALGRCIFKHLDQEGYLTETFFNRISHPERSYNLGACEDPLSNSICVNELNELFSFATGEDMTVFMREKLLANI